MDLFSFMLGKKSGGSGGGSGESVDAEKLDLYERYLRACIGASQDDWNPYETEIDGVLTKVVTVETRGMTYTVPYNTKSFAVFPEINISALLPDGMRRNVYNVATAHLTSGTYRAVMDMSRLTAGFENDDGDMAINYGESEAYSHIVFAALPTYCASVNLQGSSAEYVYSQGISIGKKITGMNARSINNDHTAYADKPVTVMEGFTGNLYLAKLNISAEHLVGIINNLGEGSYTLNLGSHNTEKLTAEQIAVATEKGWNVT